MNAGNTSILLSGVGMSDVGKRYTHNEDRWLVDNEIGLYVVADGVGGAVAGEVAAELVINTFDELDILEPNPEDSLRVAFVTANNEILRHVASNPHLKGMGAVATAVLFRSGSLHIAHVGDARLYEIRPSGDVILHTRDHSPVGELEASGQITEDEAMRHPERNEVSRALGVHMMNSEALGWVEVSKISVREKSHWLLCSDGLSDLVSRAEIAELVQFPGSTPKQRCKFLIDRANMYGGKDNITVILLSPVKSVEKKVLSNPPLLPETAQHKPLTILEQLQKKQSEEVTEEVAGSKMMVGSNCKHKYAPPVTRKGLFYGLLILIGLGLGVLITLLVLYVWGFIFA